MHFSNRYVDVSFAIILVLLLLSTKCSKAFKYQLNREGKRKRLARILQKHGFVDKSKCTSVKPITGSLRRLFPLLALFALFRR